MGGHKTSLFPTCNNALAAAKSAREALLSAKFPDNVLSLGHADTDLSRIALLSSAISDYRHSPISRNALLMTLAKRIVAARELLEWSQTDLGKEVGAAQSTVATWERGKNEPDLATIRRIAKAVNKPPEYLAFGVGQNVTADLVALLEVDVRAVSGPGGLMSVGMDDDEAVVYRYFFPKIEFRRSFGVDGDRVRILEVIGDSMLGTLSPGEKVIVDYTDKVPSPPGIFVIWDGLGLVLKRVEFVPQSDPPTVVISSDNPRYKPYDRTLDEAYIQGRVIGSWQRR